MLQQARSFENPIGRMQLDVCINVPSLGLSVVGKETKDQKSPRRELLFLQVSSDHYLSFHHHFNAEMPPALQSNFPRYNLLFHS